MNRIISSIIHALVAVGVREWISTGCEWLAAKRQWLTSKLNRLRRANYFWTVLLCGLLVAVFLVCKFLPYVPECKIEWLGGESKIEILLAYIAALATIMIPIYLLIAEQKVGIGKIGSFALLRYAKFREVTFLLIVQTVLMLCTDFGKKTDYLVIIFIVTSFITIVWALVRVFWVLFQEKSDSEILKPILSSVITKHLDAAIQDRHRRETVYKNIKNSSYIDSFVVIDKNEYFKFSIKSIKEGRIESINIEAIDRLTSRLFGVEVRDTKEEILDDLNQNEPKIKIQLDTLGYGSVKSNDSIGAIYLLKQAEVDSEKRYQNIEKLKRGIIKNIKIRKGNNVPIALIRDWLDEVECKIEETRPIDGTVSLKRILDWYEVIVSELDSYISEKLKFRIEDAEAALDSWQVDSVSQIFSRTYQIINEALRQESKRGNVDRLSAVYDFIYKKASISQYPVAIVRSHRWLRRAIYVSTDMVKLEEEVFNRVIDLYDTFINGIFYGLKEGDYEEGGSNLLGITPLYLDDMRDMLLYAIKNSTTNERWKKVFDTISKRLVAHAHSGLGYSRHVLPDKVDQKMSNILLLVAVYAKYKKQDEQYNTLINAISKWAPEYLTERVLDCYDNRLISKWNINTFDLEADGQLHAVPDMSGELRKVWLESVRKYRIDSAYVRRNFQTVGLEKTLFFTGSMSEFENTPFSKDESSIDSNLLQAIKECCRIRWSWEENQLAKAALDKEKVDDFYQRAEDSFTHQSIMAQVLPKSKLIPHGSVRANARGYRQYGLNTMFDKEAFIKGWHVGVLVDNIASDIGRNAAMKEDSEIIETITEHAKRISIDEIGTRVGSVNTEWVVILQNINTWDILYNHKELCSKKSDHVNGELYIEGIRQKLSTFELYDDTLHERIIFIRRSSFGSLDYVSRGGGNIDFNIKSFYGNAKLTNKLIKQKPDWLRKKGMTDEEARKYLNTKVLLYLNRIFRYKPSGNEEVFVCDIADKQNVEKKEE